MDSEFQVIEESDLVDKKNIKNITINYYYDEQMIKGHNITIFDKIFV